MKATRSVVVALLAFLISTYLVDATRAGFTGFHESSVWLSLAVTALVAVAAFAAATALLARGWRLKP